MFSKLVDLLAEKTASFQGFKLTEEFMIAALLLVDDVVAMIERETK